jgi:hypothetical protein
MLLLVLVLVLMLLVLNWDESIAFSTVEYRRLIAHGNWMCWRRASLLFRPWCYRQRRSIAT